MPRKKRPEGTRAPNGAGSIYYSEADGYWHAWVTVGVKDNGQPDRRHRKARTEKLLLDKVRELEKQRDSGTVILAGQHWTIETWLRYWVEEISAQTVRDSTLSAYRVAVYHHLIPGLGAHRLERIKPEHFEKLYKKMTVAGAKPATAHQVHRTARVALNVAVARGYLGKNPVVLAKYPRVEEEEIEPYSVEEVQRLIETALPLRNGVRFIVALSTGLRQGEVLGLKWTDIDLAAGTLRVRKNRLRPKYAHGCTKPCGRKYPGYCPQRTQTRPKVAEVKSRAGRRPFPIPEPLGELLKAHRAAQEVERETAGSLWLAEDWVFATEIGDAINPRTDWDNWKDLLRAAGVRDARLHDARHTAATNLLIAGVLDRVAQGLMGWADSSMAKRYQHLTAPVQTDAAKRIGDLLWLPKKDATEGPTATETAT